MCERVIYPESMLTNKSHVSKEREARIKRGNKTAAELCKILNIKNLSNNLKFRTSNNNNRPMVNNACEA